MAERDDESLIEEMRAAIRGDRERAAARAGRPAPAETTAEPPPRARSLVGRLFRRR